MRRLKGDPVNAAFFYQSNPRPTLKFQETSTKTINNVTSVTLLTQYSNYGCHAKGQISGDWVCCIKNFHKWSVTVSRVSFYSSNFTFCCFFLWNYLFWPVFAGFRLRQRWAVCSFSSVDFGHSANDRKSHNIWYQLNSQYLSVDYYPSIISFVVSLNFSPRNQTLHSPCFSTLYRARTGHQS